jgi:hypothetical protein
MTYEAASTGTRQRSPGKLGSDKHSPDRHAALRARLGALFPAAPEPPRHPAAPRLARAAVPVAAVALGTIVLLLRIPGTPAWDSVYAEDNGEFLVGALAHPWHLLVPYGGYEQLGPRLIGQLIASFLPLVDAAKGYAVTGALIGAASALFVYHASDGYIRSRWLRAMLAGSMLLLPLAPMEVIDNGVDSPWCTMPALFFATLWRPRSRAGLLAAALIAFYTTSSELLGLIFAPLLLIRLLALPRWREQAVTAGWLAGLLVQVPVVLGSYTGHAQRLNAGRLSTPGQALAFYFHNVVLRALGWRLSLHLVELAGYNGATVIVGVILAAGLGWAMAVGGRPVRLFAVAALAVGLIQVIFCATVTSYVNEQVPTGVFLPAARYSTLPIVLIDAIAILGMDAYLHRHGAPRLSIRLRPRALVAAAILVCVLGSGWAADYRYTTGRALEAPWPPVARHWIHECAVSRTGEISIPAWNSPNVTVSCSRLRR